MVKLIAYWVTCMFLSSADFFSNSNFSKTSFKNAIRVSNIFNPGQVRRFVGPDLGPNCFQMLSADDTSRKRVKISTVII